MFVKPLVRFHKDFSPPADKSITHRALILGATAEGKTILRRPLLSLDTGSTLHCLRELGVSVTLHNDEVEVRGGIDVQEAYLDAGNSGTTARLLLGMLCGLPHTKICIDGDASLRQRPMDRVIQPLVQMGGVVAYSGKLPLTVCGRSLKGIDYALPVASAQVKSALMLAALSARGPTVLRGKTGSRNHTELMMAAMGGDVGVCTDTIHIMPGKLKGITMTNHGDFSSAAYALVLSVIARHSSVRIRDVNVNPTRTGLLDVLLQSGASIAVENKGEDIECYADLYGAHSALRPFRISQAQIPYLIDELPLLAVLACFVEGISEIHDAQELRVKESDRIRTMADGLRRMGADIEEWEDGLRIRGSGTLKGGCTLHSCGDHRVDMALCIAAAGSELGAHIEGSAAAVSYPDFFSLFHA